MGVSVFLLETNGNVVPVVQNGIVIPSSTVPPDYLCDYEDSSGMIGTSVAFRVDDDSVRANQVRFARIDNTPFVGATINWLTENGIEGKAMFPDRTIFPNVRPIVDYQWLLEAQDGTFELCRHCAHLADGQDLTLSLGGAQLVASYGQMPVKLQSPEPNF